MGGEVRVWLRVCWEIGLRERQELLMKSHESQKEELWLSWEKNGTLLRSELRMKDLR